MNHQKLILKNVRVHNLKSVSLSLDPGQLIVFTGVSGSGKSSLAFDTIYVEGQRRYVESLSNFARRQMGDLQKPDADLISGISPTVAIEQKTISANPRSTVGTLTEIYDYLRVLFARTATAFCPVSGEAVALQSEEAIIARIQAIPKGRSLTFFAPLSQGQKGEFKDEFAHLLQKGFVRVRVDGVLHRLEDPIELDGNVAHDIDVVIDRVQSGDSERLLEAVRASLEMGKGAFSLLDASEDEESLFSIHAYSPKSGLSYRALEPQDFSFNSPHGMCPRCQGLGQVVDFDLDQVIDKERSLEEDCFLIGGSYQTVRWGNIYRELARLYSFKVSAPWKELPKKAQHVLLYGTEKKWTRMQFVHPETHATWSDLVQWRGVLHEARSRLNEAKSDHYQKKMEPFLKKQRCPECEGCRLKPYPAKAQLGGKTLFEVGALTIEEAHRFFCHLQLPKALQVIAEEVVKEVRERLSFLLSVGLNYLTLNREAPSLSGGEGQRVRLASQIGSLLVGATYILDEPSIGLHPRDNEKLIASLQALKSLGNTVIVVEHDEDTMRAADYIVDFGPRAGVQGGEIVAQGSFQEVLKSKDSLTGAYLSHRKQIGVEKNRRESPGQISLEGASYNNLKEVSLSLPLGRLIAITGVSGSGKSSLIVDTLYPAVQQTLAKEGLKGLSLKHVHGVEQIDKVIIIDQSPIGRNPRSNPATYIKLFDEIRNLFAKLPESIARGYSVGRFSFNVKEGSCPTCSGMGQIQVDLDFLDDAYVPCPECHTKRFDLETLSIRYREKNIYEILSMDVAEALEFFANFPKIRQKLELLKQVGLDYLKLGQPSTTLSGGEAERIKLAKELSRPSTGKTLYLLDEPTTGLHFADIQHLLNVLNALVDKGNTVVCIEHNMEVVRTADFVVDIGPEGGSQGGEVIFAGTPEALSQQATPTGQALLKLLKSEKVATKAVKKALPSLEAPNLTVVEAETNNLKHVSATLPHGGITICTGPSGSGKSSFAFDTIYAEGQRRYTESLSPYTRQFIKQSAKPPFKEMKGLSPAIAIEQKAHAGNPRSTVGTLTEIYDYLRVLFARKGVAYCPETKEEIKAISKEMVIDQILLLPPGEKVHVLAPIDPKRDDIYQRLLSFQQMGFLRIRIGREIFEMGDTREALEALPIKKQKKQMALVIDRLKIGDNLRSRLFEALESVFRFSHSVIIMREDQPDLFFNMRFAVPSTGKSYPEITPKSFAFNLEEGMCFDCQGLGFIYGAALNEQKSLLENNLPALIDTFFPDLPYHLYHWILDLFKAKKIDLRQPIHTWDKAAQRFLLEGSDELFPYQKGSFLEWRGLNQALMRAARYAESEERALLLPFLETRTCPHCQGSRVNKLAQHVQLNGRTIKDVVEMPVSTLLPFLESIPLNAAEQRFLGEVKEQAVNRTRFLQEMGLSYLSINRSAPTLSGGETQRIRLARQLGSGLTGCLYVLDEPTIGLHPKDGDLLKVALKKLRELGNTLVLVEHDPLMLEIADYILDFGPGAGARGGQIVARGTLPEILKDPRSLTGQYLQGALQIPSPKKRRSFKSFIAIEDACLHNLKKISLQVPIGAMTVLAGVSGSGKSTLMQGILQESYRKQTQDPFYLKQGEKVLAKVGGLSHFNRLIVIDQNPIGHTARSDVGTYVEVLSLLRSVFASLPKAKAKGLEPKHFSYNHRRGMCTGCSGLGYKKIEMHFLPPVKVTCDVCQGMRLNPLSLSIQYQGLNFGDVLKLTVEEALAKFTHYPKLKKVLETLADVGLGYLCLGQEMQSLSGGEAQRIKLSRELSKRSSGKTLYLLDEPTIGLHPDDINKLLLILNRLVDKGNTMVIIEHNLEVLKTADYLIELGPVAGTQGGQVIFAGSPEEMIQSEQSITAPYLLPLIEKKAPKKLSVKRTQNRSKKP